MEMYSKLSEAKMASDVVPAFFFFINLLMKENLSN